MEYFLFFLCFLFVLFYKSMIIWRKIMKPGMDSGSWEGLSVFAPHVEPAVLLLCII
jgi:hypothetical protein